MATFEEFWDVLKDDLSRYAGENWKDFRDDALGDGRAFLEKSKDDLRRWTQLLVDKSINQEEFDWLIRSKKDVAALVALKRKGLAQVALDKFVAGLVDTVVGTAFKVFG